MGGGGGAYSRELELCEFLSVSHIFVQFGGRLFRQVTGIPMGTNCAPLLAPLVTFLCSLEGVFSVR